MKKVVENLESRMMINEDENSAVLSSLTGIDQKSIDSVLSKMSFADYVELINTITTDDSQRANEILTGYINNTDPDSIEETTGISSSTIGTTGTTGTNSPTTQKQPEQTNTQQTTQQSSTQQTQQTNQTQKPEELKVGDELDLKTQDGEDIKGTVTTPNGPNNTVTVNVDGKSQQINKDDLEDDMNEQLNRLAELAGLSEMTSAGAIAAVEAPLGGEPIKRIPGTPKKKKKKTDEGTALIGGEIGKTGKTYGPKVGPEFTAGAGMPNDNYPPKSRKKKK